MKHKKKQSKQREQKKRREQRINAGNQRIPTATAFSKDSNGEIILTDRGILLYWWFWHEINFLSDFKRIIEKYGIDRVMNAVIILQIISDGSPRRMVLAIKRNGLDYFFDAMSNIYKLQVDKIEKYNDIKKEFIRNIQVKFDLDRSKGLMFEDYLRDDLK